MITLTLALVALPQAVANVPFYDLALGAMLERAVAERNPAIKLEMALVGVQRSKRIGDHALMSQAYSLTGTSYSMLGDRRRAKVCYELALECAPTGDRRAAILNNLSIVLRESGQLREAEKTAREAVVYWKGRDLSDVRAQRSLGRAWNQLGTALLEQAKLAEALQAYQESLRFRYLADGPEQRAGTHTQLGRVLTRLNREDEAYRHFGIACYLFEQMERTAAPNQSPSLSPRADTFEALAELAGKRSRSAQIVLLKEAVRLVQMERKRISGLSSDLRDSYQATRSDIYLNLANLLIVEGKLQEAERVLDLLKGEEYATYFRGVDDPAALPRSDLEKEILRCWSAVPENLGEALYEFDRLRSLGASRTSEESARLQVLRVNVVEATKALDNLFAAMSKTVTGQAELQEPIGYLQTLVSDLSKEGAPTAAIRVFEVGGEVVTWLIAADGPTVFRSKVDPLRWRQDLVGLAVALKSPSHDPRPSAKRIYDSTIGKASKELERRGIQRLVISAFGPLRYLPMAALWDGEHYLVERFACSYTTPWMPVAGVRGAWRVAAFAAGESPRWKLPKLEGALREADTIVQSDAESTGIFPGKQYLGKAFTPNALYDTLDVRQERVVHLATHFVLKEAAEDSFLITGNDEDISLLALEKAVGGRRLFQDIDLLYLSACSTAEAPLTERTDGRELDSFAAFSIKNSARAVIASLWKLADQSGADLAEAFYAIKRGQPDLPLPVALQRAQLRAMNAGDRLPQSTDRAGSSRLPDVPSLPPFVPDPQRPYAHPCYWAPLILFGDPR